MANETLSPEGRLLAEHLYNPQTRDIATGAEKPADKHSFEAWVAFPKGPEWDAYYAQLQAAAAAAWPNGEPQQPGFSWKVADGDLPDNKGKPRAAHCAGHMLVSYSRSAKIGGPQIFNQVGDMLPDRNQLYPGCYVKVYGGFAGNGQTMNKGMYVNCDYVYVMRGGERIQSGPDPKAVLAGNVQPQQAAPATPGATAPPPAAPAAPAPPGAGPTPHTAIANGPAAPAAPVMYNVEGAQYTAEQLKGFGWTDEQIAAAPH